jgi:hypothetical protein
MTACDDGTKDAPQELVSKRDVMTKKADLLNTCQVMGLEQGCDLCEALGWYGDGECDLFCQQEDSDCRSCVVGDPQGCRQNEYCYVVGGGCADDGVEGVCQVRRQSCVQVYSVVCGCDGENYINSCDASFRGMNIRHRGSCESAGFVDKPEVEPQVEEPADGGVEAPEAPADAGAEVFEYPADAGDESDFDLADAGAVVN